MKRNIRSITALATVLSLAGFASAQHEDHKDKHDSQHQEQQQQQQVQTNKNPNAAYFGTKFADISDEIAEQLQLDSQDGVIVMEVFPDSPAGKAGIKQGDVIRELDGKPIDAKEAFMAIMRDKKPDDQITVKLIREKKTEEVTVTLAKRPADFDRMANPQQPQAPKEPKEDEKDPATKPS
jgi:serine protease Do